MLFWIIAAVLVALVAAAVAWPLIKGQSDTRDEADFDIEVFRDQLAEVMREHDEGRLGFAEAEAAKAEISRRILAADASRKQLGEASRRRQPAAAAALATLLAGSAFTFYLYVGSPDQPARPFAERAQERQQRTAEAGEQRMDLASLAERLKKRLREDGDSVQGWQLLARTYMTMGSYTEAIPAFERVIDLGTEDAGTYAAYGEAIALAAQGSITPRSQAAFRQAMAKNAKEPTARFYLSLAAWQAGNHREAYDGWTALLAESRADAPWIGVLRQRLAEASSKLGLDVASLPQPLPAAAAAPDATTPHPVGGPSQEDVAAARDMAPEDRQQMIRGMVDGLAAKLEADPGNFQGWMQLIRSYGVLGEKEKAKAALDTALAQFARAPFVKRQLLALGGELGLGAAAPDSGATTGAPAPAPAPTAAPPGPTAEDMKAAQEMSPEEQRQMIEGMVAGLAAKLEENPNDLQGWIRLARSYSVLGQPAKAEEAMAKAARAAPENVDILTLYARTVRSAAGNRPTATSAEIMQKVLTLQPENVEALFFTGLAAAGAGDKTEARRLWQKALAGLPEKAPERAALQRQIDSLGQ